MSGKKLFCVKCDERVDIYYKTIDVTHKIYGEEIVVSASIPFCHECSSRLSDVDTEEDQYDMALNEYRRRKNLLTPAEIKNIREIYGLSQRAFSRALGFSESTINRYELGAIQDKLHDNLISLAKNPKIMIEIVNRNKTNLSPEELCLIQQKILELTPKESENLTTSVLEHLTAKVVEIDKKLDMYANEVRKRPMHSPSGSWPNTRQSTRPKYEFSTCYLEN